MKRPAWRRLYEGVRIAVWAVALASVISFHAMKSGLKLGKNGD